jgi:sec-independent protein translocase protein TatB
MFGIGGSEIIVILIVALIFLGPDKLPDAAKKISKGIRDLKKQSRILQQQIEDDEHIGGAIRDLKSALRGDEEPVRPKKINKALADAAKNANTIKPPDGPELHDGLEPPKPVEAAPETAAGASTEKDEAAAEPPAPAVTLPATAGERDPESPEDDKAHATELAAMIRPASGTVGRSPSAGLATDKPEREHG